MKEIQLTRGYVTVIDDDSFKLVSSYKWCVCFTRKGGKPYAMTWRSGKFIRLHRLLCGVTDPKIQVDHINGDGLDNRKSNLRLATQGENVANRPVARVNKTSKYKGVSWTKLYDKWLVQCKRKFVGYYDSEEDAAHAYDEVAKRNWPQFAQTNFT